MANLHLLIKFWARKDPDLILHVIGNSRLIVDPFCGSGSSGFVAVLKKASAILSDINPVSVFITYNTLNKETLKREILEEMREICLKIENEVYTLNMSERVNFAIWENEEIVSLRLISGKTIRDKRLIKEYLEIEEKLKLRWYPNGEFIYPGTSVKFKDGPHKSIKIVDLFTKRNLYAVSKIYYFIEKIWRHDRKQGDLLKLAFIASLANATKMIPHAPSGGPSWKIPRYWIPRLREERNFCRTFMRRLIYLAKFKETWASLVSDYHVTVSFEDKIEPLGKNFIYVYRADALKICEYLPASDSIILDPPHYDQLNYFELTYLWQKWLEGRYKDKRFKDYKYWRREICVNKRIGKDLQWYNNQIYQVIKSYMPRCAKNGKIILILHNRDKKVLEETVNGIRNIIENNFKLSVIYKFPKVPSTTQGLHRRRKYLCIMRIKRVN